MRLALYRDPVALVIGLLGLVLSIAVAVGTGDSPGVDGQFSLLVTVAFALSIVLGEWFQLSAPGFRGSAPIATAAALAFAFAVHVGPVELAFSTPYVLAVTSVSMALGAGARVLGGREVSLVETTGRFIAVAVAALLYRNVHLGQNPGGPPHDDDLVPWQRAMLMLAICVAALVADTLFTSVLRAMATADLRRTFIDEARSSFALSGAVAVTGVLVALTLPTLGVMALPLFILPLVLTLFAFRRYVSIRATYLQSIRTLSRLTDAAGYTPSGHSERVAALSVRVGRQLGVSERDLLDLEYAALLHDIGQVALVEPIPGGATVLAAPADQRRIAADSVAIVRETGVFEGAARILEHQTTPYRQVRELGEEIPLTSRILKVVNAYEDLTAGARSVRAREAAVERIYLGLGYEYDPRVVDALLGILGSAHQD
jgi:hypothetical protein